MARSAAPPSVTSAIEEAVRTVVERMLPTLLRSMKRAVDVQVGAEARFAKASRSQGKRSRPRVIIDRWVPDVRARRVPNFVIEATGLKTKKAIVARFGSEVTFVKGKPLPPLNPAAARKAVPEPPDAREVRAKPPLVRKRGAAGK